MAVNPIAKSQKEASNKDFLPGSNTQATDPNAQRNEDAKKLLLAELRDRNRKENTFDFQMFGDLRYAAGITIQLDDSFGNFSGKYLIDKVVHKIGRQGYTSDLSGHKCLVGYEEQTSAPPKAPKALPSGPFSPGKVIPIVGGGSPTPINVQLGGTPK
jgi:hypothetical protein